MRIYSTTPRATAARAKRQQEREARLAAGWVDKRYGPHHGSRYAAVKLWRQRNGDTARLLDRLYKAMKRSKLYQEAWPQIVAHYGPCVCCRLKNRAPQSRTIADHVIRMPRKAKDINRQEHNCLANLQPLCNRCNLEKYGQDYDYRPDKGEWIMATFPEAREVFHLRTRITRLRHLPPMTPLNVYK